MATLAIINPATGRSGARYRMDDLRSIRAKTAAARAAQPAWAARPLRERLDIIRTFRERLGQRADELAALLTNEMGKPITQARAEIAALGDRIDFFLAATPRVLRPQTVRHDRKAGLTERITREPLGLVANISAWNYPYFVGGNVFIPALLTGNAVLYKPSEFVAGTGLALTSLLHDSGVPGEVFAPIIGTGDTGALLLKQDINAVNFTGSHGTGQRIARAVAGRLVRVQLELGGKDPVYVTEDVALEAAARSLADGAFYNTGQSCCSVERIYVHASIHDAFVDALVAAVKALPFGDPLDDGTYFGPLTRRVQLQVLEAQVREARGQGATVHIGGRRIRGPGNYFQPTVLTNVTHRMEVMREESFGPIIGIMAVRDDDEAVQRMNDTRYGLTAGIYCRDARRAERVLAQVRAGSAYWNCCDRVSPALPWSGRGDSGLGVTLAEEGILTFTQPKAWHLRSAP